MNLIAVGLSLFILFNVGDRLRLVNWKTAKARVVVLLLVEFGAGAAGLWCGFTGAVPWFLWLVLVLVLVALYRTRAAWRFGIPHAARTDHGALDNIEAQR